MAVFLGRVWSVGVEQGHPTITTAYISSAMHVFMSCAILEGKVGARNGSQQTNIYSKYASQIWAAKRHAAAHQFSLFIDLFTLENGGSSYHTLERSYANIRNL